MNNCQHNGRWICFYNEVRGDVHVCEDCETMVAKNILLVPTENCINTPGHDKLHQWFGLSYASFLILPRVLMQAMPNKWQGKMAELLNDFGDEFDNMPDDAVNFTVRSTRNGKMIKMPDWLCRYRHPDKAMVDSCRQGR